MNLVDKNAGEYIPDNLFNDTSIPVLTKSVILKPGQGVLIRGTILGIESESGQAVIVNSASANGSGKADCILTDDIDTGTTDPVTTTAYNSGMFNRNALIVGGTDTVETHEKELRSLGIFMKDNLS